MAHYNDTIRRYFFNERGVGAFGAAEPDVYTGRSGTPAQGVMLQIQLQVEAGVVIAARYQAYGDPVTIATMAYLNGVVQARPIEAVAAMSIKEVMSALDLPPTKTYCAVHALEALRAALRQYDNR